jgi:signal transduction histidine kinase
MERTIGEAPAAGQELYRFLDRTLFWLEASTIAVLLLITLAQPTTSRVGLPTWGLVLLFAGYSLVAALLQRRLHSLRAFAWRYVVDLVVIALLYFLGAEPGGPLFVLFVLAIDCAAATMTLRGTLLYTAAALAIVGAIDLVLLSGPASAGALGVLTTRLVVLALIGVGMAIVVRRLLLEQEVNRSMRDEAARLEELERLRSNFISTVSHDLRTPLTATLAGIGMLETSAADRLRTDERELLANARRSSERLGLLIDDLLAYNQLEAGSLRLEREPLDLRAVVMHAVSTVRPLIREKEQTLEADLPEPLPSEGDPRLLERVVVNLLANAHRHTPAGTHTEISGRVADGEALLSVSDGGPGIPAEELENVFRRFQRLPSAEGGSGSGLGLAIAKGVVELHGGRIWAESRSGGGTTFHVALPRRDGEEDER